MKRISLLVLLLTFTLPLAGQAASARHHGVRKPVHHTAAAATATATQSIVTAPASEHPAGSRPFSDVPPGHWAAAAVETLRQRGIVNGYPAGTYRKK